MINHLRTLLLNTDGTDNPGALYPGEQFVPANYRAFTPPQELRAVSQLLFGGSPDRATMNWRLQEMLSILHASEYAHYATDLDPRITYLPFNNRLLKGSLRGPVAVKLTGGTNQQFYFLGQSLLKPLAENIYFRWQATVQDSSTLAMAVLEGPNPGTTFVNYTVTDGISSPLSLPNTNLSFRFDAGAGASWVIDMLTKPLLSWRDAATDAVDGVTDDLAAVLFGQQPVAPYDTFLELWRDHDQLPYRQIGLVLALGYRLNEARG